MSCIFCNSFFHVSQNCDIHVSDKLRQKAAVNNLRCRICLAVVNDFWCDNNHSKMTQKCFICFSKNHHTVYCPNRSIVSHVFTPNIDLDLLPRFIKGLNFEETFLLIFSCPNLRKFMRPIKVGLENSLVIPTQTNLLNYDLIVAESFFFFTFYSSVDLKLVTFWIENVEINSFAISSNELLQLLSWKTKTLKGGSAKFQQELKFSEIIKKAPNLEFIDIYLTNIKTDPSWLDIIQSVKKLRYLSLTISDFNFDIKSLAAVIKKRFTLVLYFNIHENKNLARDTVIKMINKKISDYFYPVKNGIEKYFKISFPYSPNRVACQYYELKNS